MESVNQHISYSGVVTVRMLFFFPSADRRDK